MTEPCTGSLKEEPCSQDIGRAGGSAACSSAQDWRLLVREPSVGPSGRDKLEYLSAGTLPGAVLSGNAGLADNTRHALPPAPVHRRAVYGCPVYGIAEPYRRGQKAPPPFPSPRKAPPWR